MTPEAIAPIKVVCFGECVWDRYHFGRRLAGAPLNVAARCNSLGVPATLVSAVGDDALGLEMCEALRRLGVSALMSVIPHPTSEVGVELDEEGRPTFFFADDYAFEHIPKSELSPRALYFGTCSALGPDSEASLNDVLDRTGFKAYDPNIRPAFLNRDRKRVQRLVHHYLQMADLLKLSDEDTEAIDTLLGVTPEQIHAKYDTEVFVTYGAAGAAYIGRYGKAWADAPRVNAIDTVGCGDAFMAYILCGTLDQRAGPELLPEAVSYASTVATFNGALGDIVESP